jgi:hypothetical protein
VEERKASQDASSGAGGREVELPIAQNTLGTFVRTLAWLAVLIFTGS